MNKFDKTVNEYLKEAVQPNGPVTNANSDKVWYKDGKRHRLDGPAVERANGDKVWYINGKRHRLDGPAVEYANGDKLWYKDGKRHRLDGPAVEYASGDSHWFLNDQILSPKEVTEHKQKLAIKKEIQGHKNNRIDPGMLEDYL